MRKMRKLETTIFLRYFVLTSIGKDITRSLAISESNYSRFSIVVLVVFYFMLIERVHVITRLYRERCVHAAIDEERNG